MEEESESTNLLRTFFFSFNFITYMAFLIIAIYSKISLPHDPDHRQREHLLHELLVYEGKQWSLRSSILDLCYLHD